MFSLATAEGRRLDVVWQVSDDGAAFRYVFPERDEVAREVRDEVSSFRFPEGTKAWLQPMAVAKTGWKRTNLSYAE